MSEASKAKEFTRKPILVEPAELGDEEAIFDVQFQTWLATYPNEEAGITAEDIRVRLEGEHGELRAQRIERWRQGIETAGEKRALFVVRDEGKIIGFVAPGFINGQRRIGAIYMLPEAQGHGSGTALLDKALEWHGRSEDIFLHVATYNLNAIDFYEHNGFEKTGNQIEDTAAIDAGDIPIPEIEMVLRAEQV